MGRRKLTEDDLNSHLQEQLRFIEASCDAFDNGFDGEAKRLAVSLRILFHDTKSSKSLMGQLNLQDRDFTDTAFGVDPNNKLTHSGLIFTALGGKKTRYVAMLDEVPFSTANDVKFENWWNKTVFVDNKKRQLSRKDLVTIAANQDGGAHVDPKLDEAYADLSKENSLGWITTDGEKDVALENPERAAIRQIAHEALKTLKSGYSKKPSHDAGVIVGGMSVVQSVRPPMTQVAEATIRKRRIGSNEPCYCGSGKKYKRCHLLRPGDTS